MKRFCLILFLFLNISFFLTAQNPDPPVFCNANFRIYINTPYSDTIRLDNISNIQNLNSDEKVIYEWDFGDLKKSYKKSPSHIYLNPDYYNICLTVIIVLKNDTTNVICESNSCEQTLIGNPKTYNIGGQIFGGNFPVKSGSAYIFRIHPDNTINNKQSMMFDTLGYFYFYQILEGDYLLKVFVPDTAYFPTYFGNSFLWYKSKKVKVLKNLYAEDINLVPTKPTTGTGRILGQLNIDNTNSGTVKNVEIILTDINSTPLIYRFTDRKGIFSFNDIAFGTYKLYADEAGWIHAIETLAINESNPVATTQIKLTWSPDLAAAQVSNINSDLSFNLFPVPTDNILYIDMTTQKATEWQFEIYTITGIRLLTSSLRLQSSGNRIPFDISHFARGIYFMRITSTDDSSPIIQKFIKD